MSNLSYFRTRWSETSSRSRRASRRTRDPQLGELVLALGRGWFTRRLSRRAAAQRLADLSREGRAAVSVLGWRRRA